MNTPRQALCHVVADAPRVLVVDGSRLVRRLITGMLAESLPNATIREAGNLVEARRRLDEGAVDLVTTSLALPDGDGCALAATVREASGQAYVPVIVVSGEAQARLEARTLGEEVTDWFDKSLGMDALATFIRGYVDPAPIPGAHVLYVEDSRVVALATKRMLEAQTLRVTHVASAEDAIAWLDRNMEGEGCDLILTDLYLNGALTGKDVLAHVRDGLGLGRRRLPVLVMTGDENADNQRGLIQAGANDLVMKPIEERVLLTKVLFQLRVAALPQAAAGHA